MENLKIQNAVSALEQLSLDELTQLDGTLMNSVINKARLAQGTAVAATLKVDDKVIVNKKYLKRGAKPASSYTIVEVDAHQCKIKSNDTGNIAAAATYMIVKI
jgi:hypothetical protein